MEKRQMKITDTHLFRSLCKFNQKLTKCILNTRKDAKIWYGDNIMRHMCDAVLLLRKSFNEKDREKKCAYIEEMLEKVEICDLLLNFLKDSNVVGINVDHAISKEIGEIVIQAVKWRNTLTESKK